MDRKHIAAALASRMPPKADDARLRAIAQAMMGSPARAVATPQPLPQMGTGAATSYTPSLRDRLGNMVYDAAEYVGLPNANRMRNDVKGAVDFVPGVGDAVGFDDAANAFNSGNYGSAALNAAASAVGTIPGAGDFAAGALKAIIPVPAAKMLNTAKTALDNDLLKKAVENTPGARMDVDGAIIPLVRNQKLEQAGQESVRGGVFYLPQGSKDARYYSGTGPNYAYGGAQNIKGETLVSNPLVVKGATGGKAPEAAYDQLMGKGAYQKMRQDVLSNAITPYYVKDESLKAERVSAFLEKYAPELVGMEYEILANSTKGNQLAYALQEAAVASAARRAGHDAVVGYSTKRTTKEPFISEVFDVRERSYPTPQGDFDVWDQFKK